jgi:hypothetical protein
MRVLDTVNRDTTARAHFIVDYEITSERIVSFSVLSTLTLKHLMRLLLTMIMKTLSILYMTFPAISLMMM